VNQEAVLQDSTMDGISHHVGLFVIGSALAVLGEYFFHAYQTSGTLRASEIFFNTMLDTVVQMPLTWIDSISMGDLTQRFSADSQAMDDRLMPLVSEFLQCAMEMMTIIVVGYVRDSSFVEFMLILVKSRSVIIYRLDGPRRSLR
jgi:ABC-type multidrug transport system fused ATPase/permease subunit